MYLNDEIKSARSSVFWKIYGLSRKYFLWFLFFLILLTSFFTGWYVSCYLCVFFKLFTRGVASHGLLGHSHLRKKERKKGMKKKKGKNREKQGKKENSFPFLRRCSLQYKMEYFVYFHNSWVSSVEGMNIKLK